MNILEKSCIRKCSKEEEGHSLGREGVIRPLVVLLAGLFLAVCLALCAGSAAIPLQEVVSVLFGGAGAGEERYGDIILYVRLPRVAGALLSGGALAASGAILQTLLNNPLAGPNIIGVNSGAGLFAVLAALLFPGQPAVTSLFSFLGAVFATLLVYLIAYKSGASRLVIVLAGVAIGSFLGALIDSLIALNPQIAMDRSFFLVGGLSGISMSRLLFPGILILSGLICAGIFSYDLDLLALGDETAASLGLNVRRFRLLYIVIAALLAGSAVSFTGLLGFVGLIIPHLTRLLCGHENRRVLLLSPLMGGLFVLLSDTAARTCFAPYELPVGIIMSLLGAPVFILLLFQSRRMQTR